MIYSAGGKLLLELNRVLRPGGYFVWSATPVYQKLEEDVAIWKGSIVLDYIPFVKYEYMNIYFNSVFWLLMQQCLN